MAKAPRLNADHIYQNHLNKRGSQYGRNEAAERTALIQRMYIRVLTELATNRFKWEGLPNSIDVRFLELTLFRKGLSVFYHDERYGRYLALNATPHGQFNMLDNPTAFRVYGNRFEGKTLAAKDCVPIWSNYLRTPDIDIILIYATRLAEIDVTLEVNGKNARRPRALIAEPGQQQTMANINRMIDNGDPVIPIVNQETMANVTGFDMGVHPDLLEKLHIYKTRQWSECMGMLGINHANQDKKERLVASEVDANNDQIENTRMVNLNARRTAADQINRKFGLNVTVDYHGGQAPTMPDTPLSEMGETEGMDPE